MSVKGKGINDFRFVFSVKSDNWDEDPGSWKVSEPITLGEILARGLSTQIDFTDGGYVIADEIDWGSDELRVIIK